MFKREVSACLLVLAVATSLPAAPLPDGPTSPLELRIRFDRASYLLNEPVFVEWTLTNVSRAPVYLVEVWNDSVGYECVTGPGQAFPLEDSTFSCRNGIHVTELQPDRSFKGYHELWQQISAPLRKEYGRFAKPGRFTFRGMHRACFSFQEDLETLHSRYLASNAVTITIEQPEGVDAAASGLFPQPGDMQEHRRRLSQGEVAEAVAATGSERFRAALAYQRGVSIFASHHSQHLAICLESSGSSPYLKGLAAYKLLLLKSQEESLLAGYEATTMAQWLQTEYPDTYMAQQAAAYLAGTLYRR